MNDFTLMGIDSLGRPTPKPGYLRNDGKKHLVGLFYFLWLSEGNKRVLDISKITADDPKAGYKPNDEKWGRVGDYHYWGEPFYGYYSMTDEWVIRRHMKLIMQADIDFLFFDTTNAVVYETVCHTVMKVLQEYYNEGHKIPKVMFYTNTHSGATVQRIYEEFYKPALYKDTWFLWDGKPVIIAIPEECSEETREFFCIKLSQWPNEATKRGGWPWMDFEKPQRVFENTEGVPESINVSVAQHPQIRFGDSVLYGETTNCGRAWHNGANDTSENAYIKGYNFAEQFERALETDPPVVLVTGWNEWIAGRWQGPPERPIMFVDCANYEFSRDIEMMRDGYFDNFFMQLVSYVRRYKGTADIPVTECGRKASFQGFSDGSLPRNCHGWTKELLYENNTAPCSIKNVTVSHTESALTFEISVDTMPENPEESFSIYLSLGKSAGFDYVINGTPGSVSKIVRAPVDNGTARPCDRLDNSDFAGTCSLSASGNTVTVTVPLFALSVEPSGIQEIWFKACASRRPYNKVDDFYDTGDVLPLGRLGFVYRMSF